MKAGKKRAGAARLEHPRTSSEIAVCYGFSLFPGDSARLALVFSSNGF
jgi:hypothetical protein